MNNFIHEDYIADVNICDGLIKWFHSNKEYHHKGALGSVDGTPEVDIKKKHSTDFSFDYEKNSIAGVVASYNKELQIILDRYLEIYHFASMVDAFKIVEPVNIQHYKPTEGYRTFHSERTSKPYDMMRYLVFQTYLNTVEDAGETEFFYQQYKCKAVKGKTLIWPVDWTHTHRGIVSPTEDKYLITGWFSFYGNK